MLGEIVWGLTNAATAGDVILAVGRPDIVESAQREAADHHLTIGALVSSKIKHIVDHAGEELWLELLGAMSNSPQPGAAAIERLLVRAFPTTAKTSTTGTGT
ncbi:MAG: hypothetical protein ABSA13_13530 [Beijerinckiaceae bacterium]